MTTLDLKKYLPVALVAVLAASLGWGASALGVKSNAVSAPVETAPLVNQLTSEPVQPVQSSLTQPQLAASTAPGAQPVSTRPRIGATGSERRTASTSSVPASSRKRGMGNVTKTAIAIGGGAATGAIIGGIAGGKKGAAIGALAGGGGGALYSLVRKKQGKQVW